MSDKPKIGKRILKGIVAGLVDGVPFLSNVVNAVRQAKSEQAEPVPVQAEPVTRTVTGWVTIVAIVAAAVLNWKNGNIDCSTVEQIINLIQ
jgi:hypothetical protein